MNLDNPELTAYALGEETSFAPDWQPQGAVKNAVEQTRTVAARVRRELDAEPAPNLLASQRAELMAMAASKTKVVDLPVQTVPVWGRVGIFSGMAACLVVGIGIGFGLFPAVNAQREVLRRVANNAPKQPVQEEGMRISLSEGTGILDTPEQLNLWSFPPVVPGTQPAPPRIAAIESPAARYDVTGSWSPMFLAGTPSVLGLQPLPVPATHPAGIAPRQEFHLEGGTTLASVLRSRGAGTQVNNVLGALVSKPVAQVSQPAFGYALVGDQPLANLPLSLGKRSGQVRAALESGNAQGLDTASVHDWLNAFGASSSKLSAEKPLGMEVEVGPCPWAEGHRLVRVLVQSVASKTPGMLVAKGAQAVVEFNPARVSAYRLVEGSGTPTNAAVIASLSMVPAEIPAGYCQVALYEVIPSAVSVAGDLKYQPISNANASRDMLTVRLDYQLAGKSAKQRSLEVAVRDSGTDMDRCPAEFRFSAAVAAFALHRGADTASADAQGILALARGASQGGGLQARFVQMLESR